MPLKLQPHQAILVSDEDAAALLSISARTLATRRKDDPAFPKGRLICGRIRYLVSELQQYAERLPTVDVLPEPPQLRAGKGRQSLAPTPSQWPQSGFTGEAMGDAGR